MAESNQSAVKEREKKSEGVSHEERLMIAGQIKDMIVEKYGEQAKMIALCGSTVRGEDTQFSDMEMMVILKGQQKAKDVSFLYGENYMHVEMLSEDDLMKKIGQVNLNWPFVVGTFHNIKILAGDSSMIDEVKKAAEALPEEKFASAIQEGVLSLFENVGKIKAAKLKGRNELANLDTLIYRLALKVGLIVSLMNRAPIFGSSYKAFDSLYGLPKLPENFEKDAKLIIASENPDEKTRYALDLFESFLKFAKEQGVEIESYSSAQELKMLAENF